MSLKSIKTVLLVEDNPGDARLLREMLNDEGSHETVLSLVASMSEAEAYLAVHSVDIILLDLGLPDAQGLAAVRRTHSAAPKVPLVVLTGMDDERLAARALQEGAQDYLIKGQIVPTSSQTETRGLLRAMRYAIERKTMDEALYLERERAEVTLNSIGEAVICTGIGGDITFINFLAERLTGWPREDAAGRPVDEVLRIVRAASREEIHPMRVAVASDQTLHIPSDSMLIRRDGFEIPIEDCVAPIHDREGRPVGAVIVFRDVSTARAMATQVAHLAQHDFLTGLPNRMLLNDRIGQAIASAPRHNKQVAVLFLDLDGFKHINDSLGHPIGDQLLQSVARRLVACVRRSDTVSRQGGDEFVVLLSETVEPHDVITVVKRMLESVAEAHRIDGHELFITTSIGVSVYPDDGSDAETLIKNADTAMYQAKENGRQGYKIFKPSMNVRAVERQSIEEGLRRALQRDEFSLQFQPKVNIVTGEIIGAEALLRWTTPAQGSISPLQFIPIAEDCGLILPMGAWVLRGACKQAKAWVDAGLPPITVAVNVSALELRHEDYLKRVINILDETGFDPRSLELELTESVLMGHADSTASILQSLRELGIQVAVDDFGTGYSSLSYLRKFNVDVLKIDQSFVRQISTGGDDAIIVTAVLAMARSLRLRVVAEGVETREELAFLRANHCDEAQGFYFSPPLSATGFADLLLTGIPSHLKAPRPARRVVPLRAASLR
jgi:diguanylate cyclase (GGDEF)-like protein/PAS domain S-box-containing protein